MRASRPDFCQLLTRQCILSTKKKLNLPSGRSHIIFKVHFLENFLQEMCAILLPGLSSVKVEQFFERKSLFYWHCVHHYGRKVIEFLVFNLVF